MQIAQSAIYSWRTHTPDIVMSGVIYLQKSTTISWDSETRKRREKMSNEMKKNRWNTRYLAGVAMLSAIAFILQYLEIAIPIMPGFIKFDFFDLPALIGAFAYGPFAGVLIELVKNLLHCAVSQSTTVGELSNFLLGAVFTGVAGLIYKNKKTKQRALIGGVVGAVVMGLICIPSNYFVVYPFYYKVYMPEEVVLSLYQVILPSMKSVLQCLFVFNLPFTIVKGLLDAVICLLIYKPLSPILHGRQDAMAKKSVPKKANG